MKYLLYLPDSSCMTDGKLPLILYLHGRDQRGDDLNLLKTRAIPQLIESGDNFPFIVVSPQCPSYYIWPFLFDGIMALIDDIILAHPVDPNRIYLTGLSMGGYAVWDLAMEHPGRFAAIAPVCGGGSAERAALLNNIPVWAFHGAKDEVVPVAEASELVEAIRAHGGTAKLTIYPEGKHEVWEETYANPELYSWFLKNQRKL
nr:PHB depolymerase family esterase [Paenibacillus sp. MMS18-CY102]